MAKVTSGEWHVAERGSYFGVFAHDGGRLVAACAKPHRDAESNAHAIAAIPEMIDAIEALWEDDRVPMGSHHRTRLAIALAKLEGR